MLLNVCGNKCWFKLNIDNNLVYKYFIDLCVYQLNIRSVFLPLIGLQNLAMHVFFKFEHTSN